MVFCAVSNWLTIIEPEISYHCQKHHSKSLHFAKYCQREKLDMYYGILTRSSSFNTWVVWFLICLFDFLKIKIISIIGPNKSIFKNHFYLLKNASYKFYGGFIGFVLFFNSMLLLQTNTKLFDFLLFKYCCNVANFLK